MKKLPVRRSPLAPAAFPVLVPIAGVRMAATNSGIKYQNRDDLLLVAVDEGVTVAGVLTRSSTASAPVLWCRRQLKSQQPRALVVNAGNANTFTGSTGEQDVIETCQAVAAALDCKPEQVLVASTGVIGEPLQVDKIVGAIPHLVSALSDDTWQSSAAAIMTTDTFVKGATASAEISGKPVTINGFAKGSGMIEPDMATMLAFLFTDAAIPRDVLQSLLATANDESFNAITVDSDTSTSDTCILFATGKAANPVPDSADAPALGDFRRALGQVMIDLALQVVADGEGAQKLITVEVSGAETDGAAKFVAKSIANSPLVKTAIAGEDANWGRIVMAIGKSGQLVDQAQLKIAIGGVPITEQGQRITGFDETPVSEYLKASDVLIQVELGIAAGCARVWGCDLTHRYIEINADYRS